VAVDAAGNLFIADGNNRIRRVDAATGVISTVAGIGSSGFSGDGFRATRAFLHQPTGVAVDAAGDLFIADTGNYRIRKVAPGIIQDGLATYTFTIRNTSPASTDPVTVTNVTDTKFGNLTAVAAAAHGGADIVLAPGQALTFTYTPVSNIGPVPGTVTVSGQDDEGIPATATDYHTGPLPAGAITTVPGSG
jgi:hypothetical protein